MKFKLLLASLALCSITMSAQMRSVGLETGKQPVGMQTQLKALVRSVSPAKQTSQSIASESLKAGENLKVSYRRPAGALYSSIYLTGNQLSYLFFPYVFLKPYETYTFVGSYSGASYNAYKYWDVQSDYYDEALDSNYVCWQRYEGINTLSKSYGYETDSVPYFHVQDGSTDKEFFLHGKIAKDKSEEAEIESVDCGLIASIASSMDAWGVDFLKSSCNFSNVIHSGDALYNMICYLDESKEICLPYGDNDYGFWFGKNGSHFDGIAQAFEKPEHSYLLKKVYVLADYQVEGDPVELSCKIYRLSSIPQYDDNDYVTIADEPGELIATGNAFISAQTKEEYGNLIPFTIYDKNGEETSLEINDAILVAIEGYNDVENERLTHFTAYMNTDYFHDEGYGELAYIKHGKVNSQGNFTGQYEWHGLYHDFLDQEMSIPMKGGLTIFLNTESPFAVYGYRQENGEFTFGEEGGLMEKPLGQDTTRSILFFTSVPCAEWTIQNKPAWLDIDLADIVDENGYFGYNVNAEVTAQPLPENINHREAVVNFKIPCGYISYKFIQEREIIPQTDAPIIWHEVLDDRVIVHVDGNGELTLYIDGIKVDFPYTLMRQENDYTVHAKATAQEIGKTEGTAEKDILVPGLGGSGQDKTLAPTIYVQPINENVSYLVTILPNEDGSKIYYRINGGEWKPYTNELVFSTPGEYTIEAYAIVDGKDRSDLDRAYFSIGNSTDVNSIVNHKSIDNVRYYNLAGQQTSGINGATIVVTTYTDGTTITTKVLK